MALKDVVSDVYRAACLKENKQLQDHEFIIWLNSAKMSTLESITNDTPSKDFIEKCRLAIVYAMSADFVVRNSDWRNRDNVEADKATAEASQ